MGSQGRRVRRVQEALGIVADGIFGRQTRHAVRRFQRSHQLRVTGRVNRRTWRTLRGQAGSGTASGAPPAPSSPGATSPDTATASTAPPGGRLGDVPLHRGSHGRHVRVLQRMLDRIGWALAVDGAYGHETAHAVRAFQAEHGLAVDDVVNADDAAALAAALADAPRMKPPKLPPDERATIDSDGLAVAPASAPQAVKDFIAAGNKIAHKPYVYGGGHGAWKSRGYDCSGSVSYALHGAGMLDESLDSTGFESYGQPGAGKWMTIYANAGHVYMIVAGLRFDTSGATEDGSRWHDTSRPTDGYVVRHPDGM